MILNELCDIRENPNPLLLEELEVPKPGPYDILLEVLTCGTAQATKIRLPVRRQFNKGIMHRGIVEQ